MRDLAPDIYRQRLVIEGFPNNPVTSDVIEEYLSKLSEAIGMHELMVPITHRSEKFGWAGWIHWETSGAHFYAWEQPRLFFSVDIYTCKEFKPELAVKFTEDFFDISKTESRSF